MAPLSGPAIGNLCHVMMETMPVPAVIYDDECIAYANPACRALLGALHPGEVIGRPVLQFVHPDAREAAKERLRLVRENGAHLSSVENRIVRCDGSTRRIRFCAFPVTFGGVRMVGLLVQEWED